jgi:hypothetical protein
MAYVVVRNSQGQELIRKEISGQMVIGRAGECDLALGDAKLSRLNCRIEEENGLWMLLDLNSKNGTFVGQEKIDSRPLNDNETFEIGDERVTFHTGKFVPRRPKDPNDIGLSGTGLGMLPPLHVDQSKDGTMYASKTEVGRPKGSISGMRVVTPSPSPSQPPLAFQRPPAAPKVEPAPKSVKQKRLPGWVKTTVILGALLIIIICLLVAIR